jgi:hypothetical protein
LMALGDGGWARLGFAADSWLISVSCVWHWHGVGQGAIPVRTAPRAGVRRGAMRASQTSSADRKLGNTSARSTHRAIAYRCSGTFSPSSVRTELMAGCGPGP